MYTTVPHGGVRHRTSTPHESVNKMKRKKKLCVESTHQRALPFLWVRELYCRKLRIRLHLVEHTDIIITYLGALQRKKNSENPILLWKWVRGSRSHSDFCFVGKSSQNSSKPVLIFWSSIPCVFCLYIHC